MWIRDSNFSKIVSGEWKDNNNYNYVLENFFQIIKYETK